MTGTRPPGSTRRPASRGHNHIGHVEAEPEPDLRLAAGQAAPVHDVPTRRHDQQHPAGGPRRPHQPP
jgi:hypothetical protein